MSNYTIQIASVKDFETARKVYEQVKNLPLARIDKVEGRYKVRIGLFKSKKPAEVIFKKYNLRRFDGAYITLIRSGLKYTVYPKTLSRTSSKVSAEVGKKKEPLISATQTSKVVKEQTQSLSANVGSRKLRPVVVKVSENLPQSSVELSANVFVPAALLLALASLLFYLILHHNREKKEEELYSEIARLLDERKFEELKRLCLPYMLKKPDDIIILKAYLKALKETGCEFEAKVVEGRINELIKGGHPPEKSF